MHACRSTLEDPTPVKQDELPALDIEISVLGARTSIASADEIQTGRHGVVCSAGQRRALFLPQVATARGWDGATLLAHTLEKGGLPSDWKAAGVVVEIFAAQVFAEKEISKLPGALLI